MHTLLWIAQGLLSVVFMMAGMMKLLQSKEQVAEKMNFANFTSQSTLRLIGGLEVMAAIGLTLPMLTNTIPGLTVWAAFGLMLLMVGAVIAHFNLKEYPLIGMNAVL